MLLQNCGFSFYEAFDVSNQLSVLDNQLLHVRVNLLHFYQFFFLLVVVIAGHFLVLVGFQCA